MSDTPFMDCIRESQRQARECAEIIYSQRDKIDKLERENAAMRKYIVDPLLARRNRHNPARQESDNCQCLTCVLAREYEESIKASPDIPRPA